MILTNLHFLYFFRLSGNDEFALSALQQGGLHQVPTVPSDRHTSVCPHTAIILCFALFQFAPGIKKEKEEGWEEERRADTETQTAHNNINYELRLRLIIRQFLSLSLHQSLSVFRAVWELAMVKAKSKAAIGWQSVSLAASGVVSD